MKEIICWVSIIFAFCGCARYLDASYSNIIETEGAQVKDCSRLGVITETADADDPFEWVATRRMIFRLKSGPCNWAAPILSGTIRPSPPQQPKCMFVRRHERAPWMKDL